MLLTPLMLDVQHVISLEQHVELYNPLPLTRDEEDKDNLNLLCYVQAIYTKVLNRACFTPHSQSYSVHSYKPRKPVDLLSMSPHSKRSDSAKVFAYRVHNLHVKIIKHIQASNQQYKFRVDLHKYHDALNVKYYFIIQIRPIQCPLKTSHKFQVSNARLFKVLQMIESNNDVIKLTLNFDISSTFNMEDFIIYKTR